MAGPACWCSAQRGPGLCQCARLCRQPSGTPGGAAPGPERVPGFRPAWGWGSWELPGQRVFCVPRGHGSHADPGLGGVRHEGTGPPSGTFLLAPVSYSAEVCPPTPPPPASGFVTWQTFQSLVPPGFSPERPCQVLTGPSGLWLPPAPGWLGTAARGLGARAAMCTETQRGGASRWLAPSPEHVITFVPHYEAVLLPGIYFS